MAIQTSKKILLVIRWPVGGIRTFIKYVYSNFDPQQWRFTVLAPVHFEMDAILKDLSMHKVKYIPVDERPSIINFFYKVGVEVFRGDFDIVHSHGFTAGLCTVFPALLGQTPHVMTSHDVLSKRQFHSFIGRLKIKCMGFLLSKIDVIHSVSYDAQDNLFSYFPNLTKQGVKCVVIPNGIEVDRFAFAKHRDLHGELNIDGDVFLIGFIGRFMKQKGFRYLVEAIELLKNSSDISKRFLVVTFGDGGFIREERQSITNAGLQDHFRFLPFTPEVAEAIKGLDVVVMPSLWEACPLLAMETLTCGIPLIGTNCIGLREVLNDTPAIVVKPCDGKGLASALKNQMINNNKQPFADYISTACRRFDVKKQSKSMKDVYKTIFKRKSMQIRP